MLVGHSSGPHIAALGLSNGSTQVDTAVLQAGVYDEGARGLETISIRATDTDVEEHVL